MSAALVVQWQSEERAPTPPCRRRSLLQAHVVSSVDYASRSSRASSPSERGVALIPRLLSLRSTLRAAIRQAAFASLRLPPHYKVALLVVRWQSEERARHRLVSAPPCYMRMWFSSVDNVSRSPRTSLPSEGGVALVPRFPPHYKVAPRGTRLVVRREATAPRRLRMGLREGESRPRGGRVLFSKSRCSCCLRPFDVRYLARLARRREASAKLMPTSRCRVFALPDFQTKDSMARRRSFPRFRIPSVQMAGRKELAAPLPLASHRSRNSLCFRPVGSES